MMFENRDYRKIGLNCGEYEVEGINDNDGDDKDDDGSGYEMRMIFEGGAKRQIGLKCCSKEEIQPSGTNCINCGQDNGSLWDLARNSNSKSRTFRQKEAENPRLNLLYVDLLSLGFMNYWWNVWCKFTACIA